MMKTKLSLLAFLFLPSLSFAITCGSYPTATQPNFESQGKSVDSGPCSSFTSGNYYPSAIPMGSSDFCMYPSVGYYQYNTLTYVSGSTTNCRNIRVRYVPSGSCSSGVVENNICHPICSSGTSWNPYSASCVAISLSNFNNDPSGCSNAGGYYLADGSCVSGSDAIARIFGDPLAVSGAFLFLNGFAWTAAGILALPITGGTSGAAIAYGGHAMLIGAGMIAISADGTIDFSSATASPSNDTMSGENRIKLDLVNIDGNPDVLAMTVADTSTGKVSDISTIPPEVRQRILDGNVNPTTGEPNNITPMDLSGTKSTHYDYSTNTATTQTVNSDGSISSKSTPITTVSNSDGSVTTTALDPSIAPTVTGTTSPSGSSSSWTPTTGGGSSGGTTGTTNTGGGSTGGTSSGTNENGDDLYKDLVLDDGSSKFGSLTDTVTAAYSSFTGGSSVEIPCSNNFYFDPIYFDLMGRRFTVFSMELFNSFPIEIFRTILLFAAAVTGLLITFSGGM